jgi:hypothetical protein
MYIRLNMFSVGSGQRRLKPDRVGDADCIGSGERRIGGCPTLMQPLSVCPHHQPPPNTPLRLMALQRPLRSRSRARLTPSVAMIGMATACAKRR